VTLVFERTRRLRRWRLRWYDIDERFWTRWGCRRFARRWGYRAAFIAQVDE
jgi:hypothetical protein